jgi:hypothetical protein
MPATAPQPGNRQGGAHSRPRYPTSRDLQTLYRTRYEDHQALVTWARANIGAWFAKDLEGMWPR